MIRTLLAVSILFAPTVADAKWLRAETKNFVLYSDSTESAIKDQAANLEKFAFVLRAVSNRKVTESPVKLKVYQVTDLNDIASTLGGWSTGTAAYYVPRVRGAYVVAPKFVDKPDMRGARRAAIEQIVMSGDDAMHHEITHHFMFQYFPGAYPTWYSEGFAEFYGSFKIDKDYKVLIGRPHIRRLEGLDYGEWLPMEKLLVGRSYADFGVRTWLVYIEGWLLVHYANGNPTRAAQVKKYLSDLNAGVPFAKAAEVFGDLKQLDKELRDYGNRAQLNQTSIPFKPFDVGPVSVTPMSDAEIALWRKDIDITSGISKDGAERFAELVRAAAAPYPNDAFALRILTEAETLAGDKARAAAALARWQAVAPKDPLAIMMKANAEIDALAEAKVPAGDPRWNEARQGLLAANKLASNEPRIHIAIYESFEAEGVLPPPYAQNALVFAHRVSPSDSILRRKVARDYEKRGMIAEAIATIRPAALMVKSDEEMTEKERADRERFLKEAKKNPDKYRSAGKPLDLETSREILDRLVAKQNGAEAKAIAANDGGDDAAGKK